jgi:hypothetical protein
MRRWNLVAVLVFTAVMSTGWAQAQTSDRYDDRDDDGGRNRDRFALAVGVGLVEPTNEVETYYTAALRIRVGGGGDDDSGRQHAAGDEGVTGYVEPEVGYWKASGDNGKGDDTLLGINLIGVVPFGSVDSFFGIGAGVHSVDKSLLENAPNLSGTETKFGANAQFGIDLYITKKLSAFGAGRFDLVQGSQDKVQSKVYLGLRGRF